MQAAQRRSVVQVEQRALQRVLGALQRPQLRQQHHLAVQLGALHVDQGLRALNFGHIPYCVQQLRDAARHGCGLGSTLVALLERTAAEEGAADGAAHVGAQAALTGVALGLDIAVTPVKGFEAEPHAERVALVCPEEERHAPQAQVAVPVRLPVQCVDLRVRVQVTHPLNVHTYLLASCQLEGEVAEGLGCMAQQVVPLDKATV
mmetsp:Transcript_26060/g.56900  ORF Transcript_26060/g.56900 Transcript_26060/m.56900 type:complete len:204 (-) Transcript_26060:898-1509(-)